MMNKPIIIVGKGPSSRAVKKSEKYDIATLNNAMWLAPEPTFAFFNDLELFHLCKQEDFKYITKIVCPSFLHSRWAMLEGLCSNEMTHYMELYKLFPGWFEHIEITPYQLHGGDNERMEEQIRSGADSSNAPSLDEWPGSTGVTAANWLARYEGYRDVIIMGCDPEGGYNPIFVGAGHRDGVRGFNGQGTAPQPAGYDADYNQMVKLVSKYGGRARHISELTNVELSNLELL